MNRSERRAYARMLGVPAELIVGLRDGYVEVCTDGSCVDHGSHR